MAISKSRHPDLAPLIPTLKWFYAALAVGDEPVGTGQSHDAADQDLEYVPSVPDRNPKPIPAEKLIAAYMAEGLRFAEKEKSVVQFLQTARGEWERRVFTVPAGAVTHVFGERVSQDAARTEPTSRAKAAVAAREKSVAWFCQKLNAVPPNTVRLSLRQPKVHAPIDWSSFAHVRGNVPFAEARSACGLAPAEKLPTGLPYTPPPHLLFKGMVTKHAGKAGYGADGEPAEKLVRTATDIDYPAADRLLDRLTLEQFERAQPDHHAVLSAVTTAGSMGDLVASNDNATGKRRLVRAAEALKLFLAA
ncbi:hypothetical protein [Devosia riboflavina]